jgi:hypothetical protein
MPDLWDTYTWGLDAGFQGRLPVLEQLASRETVDGPFGMAVRGAGEDRAAILDIVEAAAEVKASDAPDYQCSKKTGAIAANAAPICRAKTGTACLGDRGSHLIAKNNTIGAWAAIKSCQMWAAAPSSAWGAVPCKAM